ncbi:hypothetical protein LTR74_000806 [Friedmanniomyces endolithicus]|nr:hypothetical protein LTR74_000806 [Friedmanniomyces endolithicus]
MMATNIYHAHLPASATSLPPPTIMLSTMHADWQCWPHHDELFFDIFVTPAVTEFRDHRHKQWFKTCCLESPLHLVCGLRSAACSLPVLSSMIKVHPQGALPTAWLCQAKVKASLCACSKVCLPLLLEWLANQQGTSHILRGSLVNLVFQAGREPGHAAAGRCAGPSYGAQDLLQDGQAQCPRAGEAGRISMELSGAPIMLKIDKELAEKQKTSRVGKNGGIPTANHSVTASEESEGNEEDKTAQNKSENENIGGDTYYPRSSAVLSSIRDVDRRKAMEFHFKSFDDLRLKATEFPFQDLNLLDAAEQ